MTEAGHELWVVVLDGGAEKNDGREGQVAAGVERARRLVPRDRIVVAVPEQRASSWLPAIRDLPEDNVMREPRDRGTATRLLLSFIWVFRRCPTATIVLIPIGESVDAEEPKEDGIAAAIANSWTGADPLVRLGSTLVGSTRSILRAFEHTTPWLLRPFLRHMKATTTFGGQRLRELYSNSPNADLWSEVLDRCPEMVA